MRNSYIIFVLKRDKKILIICLLILYICYNIVSSQQCVDTWETTVHVVKEEIPSEYDKYEYAVLIASAPANYERRTSIRNSWMKLATNTITANENKHIKFFFVVGTQGLRRNDKMLLHSENRSSNDMLLLDSFVDSYKALTPKMLLSLKWISSNMRRLKYLIKCDDDSFLRIDLLVHNLDTYAPAMDAPEIRRYISRQERPHYSGLYWGYFNGRASVFKSGKWEEKNWFLCDHYLPYALGGAYVISRNIVDFIARNAGDLSQYNSEDVSMGVWTSSIEGLNRVHDLRFDTSATSRGCSDDMLVRHKVSATAMLGIYQIVKLSYGKRLCRVERVNNYYVYNWTVMPSMCC